MLARHLTTCSRNSSPSSVALLAKSVSPAIFSNVLENLSANAHRSGIVCVVVDLRCVSIHVGVVYRLAQQRFYFRNTLILPKKWGGFELN